MGIFFTIKRIDFSFMMIWTSDHLSIVQGLNLDDKKINSLRLLFERCDK